MGGRVKDRGSLGRVLVRFLTVIIPHVRACALNEMAPTIQGEFTRGLVLCEIFLSRQTSYFWRLCRVGAAVCGTDLAVR